jgi:hypothetical protein
MGRRALTVVLASSLTLILLGGGVVLRNVASASPVPRSVLVVGDSVVAQASRAISRWAPRGATVWPMGGLGTAPCDWVRDGPAGTRYGAPDFYRAVDRDRPAAVVLAFTGNPGLSGAPAGCVDADTQYPLAALLTSYRKALLEMARYATSRGARVYLAATPPRNPATPPGRYQTAPGRWGYGFNGVPALNALLQQLASSPEGVRHGWTYDTSAAASVSDPGLTWRLRLACQSWDGAACRDGTVQVRAGGWDSIHLDPGGHGAARYGMAITRVPLENQLR